MQSCRAGLILRSLLLSGKQDCWVMPILSTGPLVCLLSPLWRQLSAFWEELPLTAKQCSPCWCLCVLGLGIREAEWMAFSESWLQEEGGDCHFLWQFFDIKVLILKAKSWDISFIPHCFPHPSNATLPFLLPLRVGSVPAVLFHISSWFRGRGRRDSCAYLLFPGDTGERPMTVPHPLCTWHKIWDF